ncbi:DUF4253 domain-containing protein [Streptomyces sp. C10-9-1]|uniref:DUF4253 domain-containing protein n=1 Tax=Streptomyces sp. C10-9-1 TaxID=1859285 RepID=UPI00211116EF|nr:DUF4253 domain-containing protein [Streptomyces sp. C10-9-1]MCQ6555763.1 DUF4253 domain-containing protein [Streptomyces sp. C10-9-1]
MSSIARQLSAEMRRLGHALRPARVVSAESEHGVAVHGFPVDREQAPSIWRSWRAGHRRTGLWPVITSVDPVALAAPPAAGERLGPGGPAALRAALSRDPESVVAEVVDAGIQDVLAQAEEDEKDAWLADLTPGRLAPRLRPADRTPRPGSVWAKDQLWTGDRLWLCLVEAAEGFELPALLPGVPDAPNWWSEPARRALRPADHVAFLRSWHERFGAEVFLADGCSLRLVVERPPLDPLTAAQVAVEQFVYCGDVAEDMDVMGDERVRSTVWSFWWD